MTHFFTQLSLAYGSKFTSQPLSSQLEVPEMKNLFDACKFRHRASRADLQVQIHTNGHGEGDIKKASSGRLQQGAHYSARVVIS